MTMSTNNHAVKSCLKGGMTKGRVRKSIQQLKIVDRIHDFQTCENDTNSRLFSFIAIRLTKDEIEQSLDTKMLV